MKNNIIDTLFYGPNGVNTKYPEVGMVTGIYHQGQTAFYSLGTRTINGKEPLDENTVFEIGSITKTMTSLLLAEAILKGKVRANDFIDKYLPEEIELPAAIRKQVKLTDLASHQSGLPDLAEDNYVVELLGKDPGNPFRSVDKSYLYDVLKKTESLSKYGHYQYNNFAFALLGEILERIYEQTFSSLVIERILHPLKMQDTTFGMPEHSNVAGLYNPQGEPQEYMIFNAIDPAGGLKSNAFDLMKYLKVHLDKSFFRQAIELSCQKWYEDADKTVGLGWEMKDDYCEKNGETLGNSSLIRFSVTRQAGIVVLSDHQNEQLVREAVDFIYKTFI